MAFVVPQGSAANTLHAAAHHSYNALTVFILPRLAITIH
jgi:hypothetical protein